MGYSEKLQKLCALKGLDQSDLAELVGVSKSSMSRILSGLQEPKLRLAHELARALGVPLDYLVDDDQEELPQSRWMSLSEEEAGLLRIVRRLGVETAIDRLLEIPSQRSNPPNGSAAMKARRTKKPDDA